MEPAAAEQLSRVVRSLARVGGDRREVLASAWRQVEWTGEPHADARLATLSGLIESGGLGRLTDEQVDTVVAEIVDLQEHLDDMKRRTQRGWRARD